MQWSKLKRRIEQGLADSVRGRVAFHVTGYRTAHDHQGRGWIVVDGEEVANMCHWRANLEGEYRPDPVAMTDGTILQPQDGVMDPSVFWDSLVSFLAMPIGEALEHHNYLIRALAIVDGRVGKRRLREMEIREKDHGLVRRFYELRLDAEGLRPAWGHAARPKGPSNPGRGTTRT